jgi:hypothetical protein
MTNVFPFDPKSKSGGSGPEDPMLDKRVEKLEADMKDAKASLARLEVSVGKIEGAVSQMPKGSDYATLRSDIGKIEGALSKLPTTVQLFLGMITTWAAGAAIVWAILKAAK